MLPLKGSIQPPFEMWPLPSDNPQTSKTVSATSPSSFLIITLVIKEGRRSVEEDLLIKNDRNLT